MRDKITLLYDSARVIKREKKRKNSAASKSAASCLFQHLLRIVCWLREILRSDIDNHNDSTNINFYAEKSPFRARDEA